MTKTYAARRTQAQWGTLVKQWQQSDQPARQFCIDYGLGYASFCQWRKRLEDAVVPAHPEPETSFIDLASLATSPSSGGAWNIVLSLGNGVELRLSQDQ